MNAKRLVVEIPCPRCEGEGVLPMVCDLCGERVDQPDDFCGHPDEYWKGGETCPACEGAKVVEAQRRFVDVVAEARQSIMTIERAAFERLAEDMELALSALSKGERYQGNEPLVHLGLLAMSMRHMARPDITPTRQTFDRVLWNSDAARPGNRESISV